jgi:dienelactone hydrolase
MKQYLGRSMNWLIFGISLVAALLCSCATMPSSRSEYDPPSGRGPVVILLSGYRGFDACKSYAAEVSRLGYYAVLFDGEDYYRHGSGTLRRTIEEVQRSSKALPGKVAVIGFSMGGGAALSHAAFMPDLVSVVVAYYPMTKELGNMRSLAAKFQVPTLVFAGERDTYANCCLIESMRAMESGAKEAGKPFELVVYPIADHGWVRAASSSHYQDAWQRTIKMLSQYHPLR